MAENITVELTGFDKLVKQFDPAVVRRGANSAINKIGKKARTAGVKKTREKYNIRASALKKEITFRASRPATLTAVIKIRGRKFNIARYSGARQTAAGVTYSLIRGQKKLIAGSFMVHVDDLGNGRGRHTTTRKNIYPKQRKLRRPKSRPGKKLAFKRKGANRYPIIEVFDFSAPEMFEDTGLGTIEELLDNELFPRIMRDIEFFQDKLG